MSHNKDKLLRGRRMRLDRWVRKISDGAGGLVTVARPQAVKMRRLYKYPKATEPFREVLFDSALPDQGSPFHPDLPFLRLINRNVEVIGADGDTGDHIVEIEDEYADTSILRVMLTTATADERTNFDVTGARLIPPGSGDHFAEAVVEIERDLIQVEGFIRTDCITNQFNSFQNRINGEPFGPYPARTVKVVAIETDLLLPWTADPPHTPLWAIRYSLEYRPPALVTLLETGDPTEVSRWDALIAETEDGAIPANATFQARAMYMEADLNVALPGVGKLICESHS